MKWKALSFVLIALLNMEGCSPTMPMYAASGSATSLLIYAISANEEVVTGKLDGVAKAIYGVLKDMDVMVSSIEEVVNKEQERQTFLFHGNLADAGVKVEVEVKSVSQAISRIKVKAKKSYFRRDYPLESRIIKEINAKLSDTRGGGRWSEFLTS